MATNDSFENLRHAAEGAKERLRAQPQTAISDHVRSILRRYRDEHLDCRTNTWAPDRGPSSLPRDNRCPLCREADELL